jgi:hypothetical protein
MIWEYKVWINQNNIGFLRLDLNQFGAEGWELVTKQNDTYYFKRPIAFAPNPRDMLGYDDNDGTGGVPVKPKEPELVS